MFYFTQVFPKDSSAGYPGPYKPQTNQNPELPIYNYFRSGGFDSVYNQNNNFFDDLADNQLPVIGNENAEDCNGLFNTAVYLDNKLYSSSAVFESENGNSDSINEIKNVHKSSVTCNDAKEIHDYLEKRESANSANLETDDYYEQKDEKEDNEMLEEISSLQCQELSNAGQQSSLESLKQLSSKMAELVDCKAEIDSSEHVSKLERRNQELAALLEEERLKTRQLTAQLNLKDDQIYNLEKNIESTKINSEVKGKCEIRQLQEQLQNHIQTVGILVGEKTELSAMLSQAQTSCKQKTLELEQLQERLKDSTYKTSALESELNSLKAEKMKFDTIIAEQSEAFNKLKLEYEDLKMRKDDLSQDVSEAHEKLSASSAENIRLQTQLQEINSQLSLANIRIQQLTMNDTAQVSIFG